MTRNPTLRFALLLLLVTSAGFHEAARAQPGTSMSPSGTLTCTAVGSAPPSLSEIDLSCAFETLSGSIGHYVGRMERNGGGDFPAGKRVLIWSVMARTLPVNAVDIAGIYFGQTGGDGAKRLVADGLGIILTPVTITSQIGGDPHPTTLNLQLIPAKT